MIVATTFLSCKDKPEHIEPAKPEKTDSATTGTATEFETIKKVGSSFYDWYFKNDFNDCNIIKDNNGSTLLDSETYFNKLRKLGTISEKFIDKERQRLSTCSKFLATKSFDDYESAEAYDFDDYCPDMYGMYWIKSQEPPNSFSTKNVKQIDANNATVDIYENYGRQDEPLSKVFLAIENGRWKITDIQFINRELSPQKPKTISGKWSNAMVTLHISDDSLGFEYHGQCMYVYPIRKISTTEFEMIWAREMDCNFDNGTAETFGLKKTPVLGKPFAKFKLNNNILETTYYYPEWVKKYSDKIKKNVFTNDYFKNEDL